MGEVRTVLTKILKDWISTLHHKCVIVTPLGYQIGQQEIEDLAEHIANTLETRREDDASIRDRLEDVAWWS